MTTTKTRLARQLIERLGPDFLPAAHQSGYFTNDELAQLDRIHRWTNDDVDQLRIDPAGWEEQAVTYLLDDEDED